METPVFDIKQATLLAEIDYVFEKDGLAIGWLRRIHKESDENGVFSIVFKKQEESVPLDLLIENGFVESSEDFLSYEVRLTRAGKQVIAARGE